MRTRLRYLLPLLLLSPLPAPAQSVKDARKTFAASLLQQTLYLRNLSADPIVNARWNGTALDFTPPAGHIFAALLIQHVDFKGTRIEIDADLQPLLPNKLTPGPITSQTLILVDLAHADPLTVLPLLRDALFFTQSQQARAIVPRDLGGARPPDPMEYPHFMNRNPAILDDHTCDCADRGTPACAHKFPLVGLQTFRVLSSPEPNYSEEARRAKFSGNVMVYLTIDPAGRATDLWVARAVGLGLDQKAIEAVRQYTFQPAACHDQPMPANLSIMVNFQTY